MEYDLSSILDNLPKDHPWWGNIHFYESVGSTNTMAKEMAKNKVTGGTVLIADEQTGGRGRLGRSFSSPPHTGIYMTVILKTACDPRLLMHLTCATAVAACNAIHKSTGISPMVKWTNDLVVGKRKLAGILTELVLNPENGNADYAIIGIGVNCSQALTDFAPELQDKACSIRMITDESPDRSKIAAALVQEFAVMGDTLLSQRDAIMDSYRKKCMTIGQQVSIVRGDEVSHAEAIDIDSEGGLVVRFPDGRTHSVTSGEVSVRGMYGYV